MPWPTTPHPSKIVAQINRRNGVERERMSRDWTTYRGEIAETLNDVGKLRRAGTWRGYDKAMLYRMLGRVRQKIDSANFWQKLP